MSGLTLTIQSLGPLARSIRFGSDLSHEGGHRSFPVILAYLKREHLHKCLSAQRVSPDPCLSHQIWVLPCFSCSSKGDPLENLVKLHFKAHQSSICSHHSYLFKKDKRTMQLSPRIPAKDDILWPSFCKSSFSHNRAATQNTFKNLSETFAFLGDFKNKMARGFEKFSF